MTPQTKHIIAIVAVAALGAAYEVLGPSGPYSHAFWAPIALALVTELRTALGGGAK